jgi:hypothetical protein
MTTKTKTFFLATDIDANHTVMGYGATYEDAQRDAERTAENAAVEIGDLNINEVAFDEDGEQIVCVNGGRLLWNLGNYTAAQLAQDVRRAGLI